MTQPSIPEPYLSDHLFLLIGTNPLPNLVAAQLLLKPGGTAWLLYSDGSNNEPSTKRFAERLETSIREKRPDADVIPESIPSSDNLRIEQRLDEIIARLGTLKSDIGLNYTGGTKPMALHTYRKLEGALGKYGAMPTYSYIDPRQVALRMEGRGSMESAVFNLSKGPLRQAVEISVDEIAALHGYVPFNRNAPSFTSVKDKPGLLELCSCIRDVHLDKPAFEEWREWTNQKDLCGLPGTTSNPEVKRVLDAMDRVCGGKGKATPDSIAYVLKKDPKAGLSSCKSWFQGYWLEEYCDASLQELKDRFGIKLVRRNLTYRAKDEPSDYFELDTAFMLGYQLFAISCMATQKKSSAKEHLFEVFVRARQLGGDEARIGLVCCYEDSSHLEREIALQWDAEKKVRVFGRNELKNLTEKFAGWFQTANL